MGVSDWLGSSASLSAWRGTVDRANDTARRIAERSSTITIQRVGAADHAETVRLEVMSLPDEERGTAGKVAVSRVLIVGYKDHATVTDTDIQRGDRFYYDGLWYDVTQVMPAIPDRFQAVADAYER